METQDEVTEEEISPTSVSSAGSVSGLRPISATVATTKKKTTHMCFQIPSPVKCTPRNQCCNCANGEINFEHIKFIMNCFVLSFGPDSPQLGRYDPRSDPEKYAVARNNPNQTGEAAEDPIPFHVCQLRRHPLATRPQSINEFAPRESTDNLFQDDFILRELSEMRMLLERLLENRENGNWQNEAELLDLLVLLPETQTLRSGDPVPSYPVGEWEFVECGICLESHWLHRRACCQYPACPRCLELYYSGKVERGRVQVECCNPLCTSYVHRDEIASRLKGPVKELFGKLLILANESADRKTCPRCSFVMHMDTGKLKKCKEFGATRVVCAACSLEWCFTCHAPWHEELNCKQFQKGDHMLKSWAKEVTHGQVNAQRCPKCKVYIQRSTGCDHMHCSRCKTDFCYRCGDKFRRLKFFGDHYSKMSVFGCKYRYKHNKPMQRKLVRGAIFGGKMMAAPALGILALCAGAFAVGLGVFALPLYGGIRLFRFYQNRRHIKGARQLPTLLQYSSLQCN